MPKGVEGRSHLIFVVSPAVGLGRIQEAIAEPECRCDVISLQETAERMMQETRKRMTELRTTIEDVPTYATDPSSIVYFLYTYQLPVAPQGNARFADSYSKVLITFNQKTNAADSTKPRSQ